MDIFFWCEQNSSQGNQWNKITDKRMDTPSIFALMEKQERTPLRITIIIIVCIQIDRNIPKKTVELYEIKVDFNVFFGATVNVPLRIIINSFFHIFFRILFAKLSTNRNFSSGATYFLFFVLYNSSLRYTWVFFFCLFLNNIIRLNV